MNKLLVLLLLAGSTTGCAVIATVTGSSSSTLATVKAIETVKLGADVVSYGATDKTLTDHAISGITGKDCKLFNIVGDRQVCQEDKFRLDEKYIVGLNKFKLQFDLTLTREKR